MAEKALRAGEYYGHVASAAEVAGLRLTDLEHESPRRIPSHSHEQAFLCLLLKGRYREQAGRLAVEYAPGTLVFHPPGLEHEDEIGPGGGVFFLVEYAEPWLRSLRDEVRGANLRLGRRGCLALALDLLREHRLGSAPLALEAAAVELLAASAEAPAAREEPHPRWLARVDERLREERGATPGLAELAAHAGVHPVHLARVFRRHRGLSVGAYARRLKVQRVFEQLAEGQRSLAEIAFDAGFTDQSHLTRVCGQVMGQPPGAIRRLLGARRGPASPLRRA
jgi:AraC family transcriptional regulator